MNRRSAGLFAALALSVSLTLPAAAADTALNVMVDERPLTTSTTDTGALFHGGLSYVDIVKMVRTFNGLISFGKTDSERQSVDVTLQKTTVEFAVGVESYAIKNGATVPMTGAPFVENGNFYVPLAAVAKVAGVKYSKRGHTIYISSPDANASSLAPATAPSASANPREDQPSPAQALSVVPSATSDDAGLHMHVSVTNTTGSPYVLAFTSGAQVGFLVARNGSDVFDSLGQKPVVQTPTTLSFAPKETKAFAQNWSGFASAGPGRFTMRVRLYTSPPTDFPPISLGVSSPAPSPT